MPAATTDLRKSVRLASAIVFLGAGFCALACIPAILIAERFHWRRESDIHITQFFACAVCALAAVAYLASTRGRREAVAGIPIRGLAYIAIVLAAGFLLLVVAIFAVLVIVPSDF